MAHYHYERLGILFSQGDKKPVGLGPARPVSEVSRKQQVDRNRVVEESSGGWPLSGRGSNTIRAKRKGILPLLGRESVLETQEKYLFCDITHTFKLVFISSTP
jgi:hypothetical protein